MYTNAVYYPNWRVYRNQPPSSLNFGMISHVFYAFARIDDDGSICLSDSWADDEMEVDGVKGCLRSFAALKKIPSNTHVKVILSVGGGGAGSDKFPLMAQDPTTRTRFADSARAMVDKYELDGIDIDWEHPSDAIQGTNFLSLLQCLRAALPAPRYLLTSALPAGEWALQYIPLAPAAQLLDLINLMAYDFFGPWSPIAGHQAALYAPTPDTPCANTAIEYLVKCGVPCSKILLGIPVYGRSFLGAQAAGQAYAGSAGDEGTFEFRDLPRNDAVEQVDLQLGAAWCVGTNEAGGWISYDVPETVRVKAAYAKERGLAGLFYWTVTGDSVAERSLVMAGYRELHSVE
ncbi:chitinase [Microthyrium microscopicum]|uniref:chitinase n=1 Tax=Microthyrium microscopicum TaxID=703497 RepID=A0A6A6UUF5_9PEZI|nr:chitinase [Microthyrium microscopicum]